MIQNLIFEIVFCWALNVNILMTDNQKILQDYEGS